MQKKDNPKGRTLKKRLAAHLSVGKLTKTTFSFGGIKLGYVGIWGEGIVMTQGKRSSGSLIYGTNSSKIEVRRVDCDTRILIGVVKWGRNW